MLYSVPSVRYGAGFLARTFCRLTKEMVDLAVNITSTHYVSPQHHSTNMVCCLPICVYDKGGTDLERNKILVGH